MLSVKDKLDEHFESHRIDEDSWYIDECRWDIHYKNGTLSIMGDHDTGVFLNIAKDKIFEVVMLANLTNIFGDVTLDEFSFAFNENPPSMDKPLINYDNIKLGE